MRKYVLTITPEHIDNPRSLGIEQCRRVLECMGRLLPGDVGKQVYDMGNGVYQVENDEQRDKRLGGTAQ